MGIRGKGTRRKSGKRKEWDGSSEGDRVNLIQYLILTLSFTFKLSQSLKWLIY